MSDMEAIRENARKYFDGVLMAYQDCAEIAERISAKLVAFPQSGEAAGIPARAAGIAAGAGAAVAKELADGFRAKLAKVKAMIASAPPTSEDIQ